MKRLIAIALLVTATGCSSVEAQNIAAKNREHLKALRAASAPKAGVDGGVYSKAWDEAERAAENIQKAVN